MTITIKITVGNAHTPEGTEEEINNFHNILENAKYVRKSQEIIACNLHPKLGVE